MLFRSRKSVFVLSLLSLVVGCNDDSSGTEASRTDAAEQAQTEPMAGRNSMCLQHFAAFDDDGDGAVSEKEFMAMPHPYADAEAVFQARDEDGNGELSKTEFCAGINAGRMGRGQGMGGGMQGEQRMGRGGSGRGMQSGGMGCAYHFSMFDSDGNGIISSSEFKQMPHMRGNADQIFSARDTDENGELTLEEFCATAGGRSPSQP